MVNCRRTRFDRIFCTKTGKSPPLPALDDLYLSSLSQTFPHPFSRITNLTSLTSLAVRALAIEAADAIDAGSAVEAGRTCTVIDVDAAVGPGPAVHAYARVTAV